MTINKQELINRIAELDAVASKKDAKIILDHITSTITDSILAGGSVQVSGFGKFYNFTRSNGKKAAKFKAAAQLKRAVEA